MRDSAPPVNPTSARRPTVACCLPWWLDRDRRKSIITGFVGKVESIVGHPLREGWPLGALSDAAPLHAMVRGRRARKGPDRSPRRVRRAGSPWFGGRGFSALPPLAEGSRLRWPRRCSRWSWACPDKCLGGRAESGRPDDLRSLTRRALPSGSCQAGYEPGGRDAGGALQYGVNVP